MVVIRISVRPGGGGAGEANTISSVGGGTSPLSATPSKVGVDLRVKTLSVTAPILKTDAANLITIAITSPLPVANGGTNQITNQAAIDALSNVGPATNEHVLTKDTATGNAIYKAGGGGGGAALIMKTVDETINSSTVFQDDDTLFFAPAINTRSEFFLYLLINSGNVPDFKYQFTGPSGAIALIIAQTFSASSEANTRSFSSSQLITSDGIDEVVVVHGFIKMAGTAGNIQLQWAQNVSDAGDTSVLEGAHIIWREV